MGAVAWPSGRGGFERALSHLVHVRNARCDSRLRRREDFFQNQLQEIHTCRESQGARSKRAERVFVPCDQVAPEAQARRPLRESLPPSLRSSNESAGLQGYGFTRLRSPKFLGENDGSGRTFLRGVKCAPKLTGWRYGNGAIDTVTD